jgi:hypothetical protein
MGIALQSLLKWISLMVVDSGDSEDLLLRKDDWRFLCGCWKRNFPGVGFSVFL